MTDIVVLLGSNALGGAELSMLTVARGLKQAGHSVMLLVYGKGRGMVHAIAPDLEVEELGTHRAPFVVLPFMCILRKRRPQIVLSALRYTNMAAIAATRLSGCGACVLITEHTPLSMYPAGSNILKQRITRLMVACAYPFADGVVTVSHGLADILKKTLLGHGNIHVIHNPVVQAPPPKSPPPPHAWLEPGQPPVILGIGRLSWEKDFALLLHAFADAQESTPLRLIVLGEGEERKDLEALAKVLGVQDRVLFPGFVANVSAWLAHAKLFVSSSRFEGFGNVIVEAMHAGVPVIATDCPVGSREILENGRYGRLTPVGEVLTLSRTIREVLANPQDTRAPYARAQQFSAQSCIAAYERLISRLPPHASLWQRLRAKACGLLFQESWMIGWVNAPIEQSLHWTICPKVEWIGERSAQRYLADPFAWPGAADTLLCEEYDYASNIGSIKKLKVNGNTLAEELPLPLPLPGHLSFPFLLALKDQIYCILESAAARTLKLLHWENGSFTEFATPLHDVAAADSVLFQHENLFWIAYTDTDIGVVDNLNLCFAPSLSGPWQPHPHNPVKRSLRNSRGAGTPFRVGGMLYRPAQDCTETYGGAVCIMRVTVCTPESYHEEEVTRIAPEQGINPHGFHTLSANGDRCLVDGKRMVFSPELLLKMIKRRVMRIFGT